MAVIPIFAQVIDPPADIVDVVGNLDLYMGSLLGLSVLSVFLTGIVNGWLKNKKDWVRQVTSWLVPILLAFIFGGLLKFGFLGDQPLFTSILYGFAAGLVSNGFFDINFVQTLVTWLEEKLNNKKEVTE